MPKYGELTVKVLYEKSDEAVKHYLPDWDLTNRRKRPEKAYVWTVMLTLKPDLCHVLVCHAQQQREEARLSRMVTKNCIMVNEFWL